MIENHHRCIKVSDTGICPFCYSHNIIRNGTTKTKKQQYICKDCHKRFLDYYTYKAYCSNINFLIIQLTKEGLGIRSIARILQISAATLFRRIKNIAENILSFGRTYELNEMRFLSEKPFALAEALQSCLLFYKSISGARLCYLCNSPSH